MSTMETTSFSMVGDHEIDFPEFSGQAGCLLDSIDFDDLFVGIHFDGDMLPEMEMEMDPEILAEFSTGDMEEDSATSPDTTNQVGVGVLKCSFSNEDCISKVSGCVSDGESKKVSVSEMETKMDKEDEVMESEKSRMPNLRAKKGEKTKISPSSHAKNNNNNNNNLKRKTKVDWTPDLHRRFVQAVEQLGVDKAVPSRILELMGVGRLTRHNIASHLQKYRTHRKHLQAREAEAASWSKKRQVFGAIAPTTGGGKVKVMNHPWPPPTIGFPPPGTPPPPHHHHHPAFHPLHVWGHPSHLLDQNHPIMPGVWPKQLVPSPSPLPQPLFWHSHHQYRFAPPLVQGIPPPHVSMYKPEHGAQSSPNQPPTDSHPTKERIDEAIGDVLTKPWLPLPIGLKPPSMEGVIEELQRQGVPNIPPSKSL